MTTEVLVDRQLDLGLAVGTQRATLPLVEVRISLPGARVLGELMANQHMDDRSKPYFGKSAPGPQIDAQWASIAGRNPEYSERALEIQRAMREARRVNALAEDSDENDYVGDYYDEVTDPSTQAVLKDMLRLYVYSRGDEYLYDHSKKIGEEISASFPSAVDDEGVLTFEGVTAGDLFALMLEGMLTLPGHPIEPRTTDEAERKHFS